MPNGLVGWWPGDGSAVDIAGANNGSLAGNATANAAGVAASAFGFDGTNGYVQIPDSLFLHQPNLTVEAWVRFSSLDSAGSGGSPAGEQYIVFKQNTRSGNFEGFDVGKDRVGGSDFFRFTVSSASGQIAEIRSSTTVSAGVWYHVAAVRGSNFTQIYVNGQLERQTNVNFPQDYGSLPLFFGTSGQSYWDHKFNGNLDEVSLYNRALSANEIAAIYTAGSAAKCKGPRMVSQPQSQTVLVGANTSFTVTATGQTPLSYRWRKNDSDLSDGGNVYGASSPVLTLMNVQTYDAGNYLVVATNPSGAVTSAVATLVVTAPRVVPQSPVGADAVVLVNSSSPKYVDFQHYIQPYLGHFGVPYTVLDITTNALGTNLGRYALIIIGHSQLDTNRTFLALAQQAAISTAVSQGVGLVNFDRDLSAGGGAPRYQFVQDIFGFTYGASQVGGNVSFPATEPGSQMHYITALHQPGESLVVRSNMSLVGITLPQEATAVALSGGFPFVAVRKYGQGHAVQWCSYDWAAVSVKGPMAGLDDLVWRSLVWAARKPFVLRGLPNFVTMRVDDVEGALWWAHMANDVGLKPWIGPFISAMKQVDAADLRSLITNGNATASVHAFTSGDFVYWNHTAQTNWPDDVLSNRFYWATQWYLTNGIPISKIVVPHYSEIGANAFSRLKSWGSEFLMIRQGIGMPWGAPWMVAGPYRLYETPQTASGPMPFFYADFLSIPGHAELAGQFFECVTTITDDASCGEWCPDNDVAGATGRGTRQLKRALDGMALATLFTHEWYIHPTSCCGGTAITTDNWRTILQNITNSLASYHPIYVTLDYACQYVRATRTSRIVASSYDPLSGQVSATLSGSSDMDTLLQVFVGVDNSITNIFATVPAFSGSVNIPAVTLAPRVTAVGVLPDQNLRLTIVSPSNFNCRVEGSTDLLHWGTLANLTNPQGMIQFTDLNATNFSRRFYRSVWAP
jgi:hypothetical protein